MAVPIEPLRPLRLAEPYERMRDVSDRILAQTGFRPKIFLANLGTPADFTARAAFAKNFFEAGGIETMVPDDATPEAVKPSGPTNSRDLGALIAAFRRSGARLACLCSSDEVYAKEGGDAAKALRAAGAEHVYLAGRAGEQQQSLPAAGVQTFIYSGCDALATLQAAHDILGIKD